MSASGRSTSVGEPPLADTLRLMMPSAPTALLLQAALLQGDAVENAWSQWRRIVPDPKAFLASDRVGIKRHLPLLYRNLAAHRVDVGRDLEPYFRAARAREELRSTRYRRFLSQAIVALLEGEIDFVVGKGVTVGETIHTDPVVRHSHDIDLLVRPHDIAAAAQALQRAGFPPSAIHSPRSEPRFDHASGLPVELHGRLYRTPFYKGELSDIWGRTREGEILGMPVKLIGDADLLVHALVHASTVSQRYGLSWIVDVVSLLRERASQGVAIDWVLVTRIAREAQATLPMYVMCQYLATTFDAPIPLQLIDELRRLTAKAGPLQHLAAMDGLRAEQRLRRVKLLVTESGWPSRLAIARALLLPPPAYLKEQHSGLGAVELAMLYVKRPARFAARQLNRLRYRLEQRLSRKKTPDSAPGLKPLSSSPGTPGEDRGGGIALSIARLSNSAPTPTLPRSTRGGGNSESLIPADRIPGVSARRLNVPQTAGRPLK